MKEPQTTQITIILKINIFNENQNSSSLPTKPIENTSEKSEKLGEEDEEKIPLYVMNVELEKGNFQSIKIYEDTKPEELANEFCQENSLDINSLHYLTEEVENLMKMTNENKFSYDRNTPRIESIQEDDEENID